MTLDLKKGDPWPFKSVRGLIGAPIAPVWYALITAPQREAKTAEQLGRVDIEVHYPTVDRVRHVNGKRHDFQSPMISRIIYAKFKYQPHWDVMRERRIISGVFSNGLDPVALDADDISRIMGLPTEEERMRAAEIEALMPKVGGRAEFTEGPFSGFFVDVTRMDAGKVWYEMVNSKVKGQADISFLRKVGE